MPRQPRIIQRKIKQHRVKQHKIKQHKIKEPRRQPRIPRLRPSRHRRRALRRSNPLGRQSPQPDRDSITRRECFRPTAIPRRRPLARLPLVPFPALLRQVRRLRQTPLPRKVRRRTVLQQKLSSVREESRNLAFNWLGGLAVTRTRLSATRQIKCWSPRKQI